MQRNDFPVSADERHGGDKQCFFCGQPVGAQHAMGCVQRTRPVVVRFTIDLVLEEPEHFTPENINFGYNESSRCAESTLHNMGALSERVGCLCGHLHAEYLREATDEDIEAQKLPAWKQG